MQTSATTATRAPTPQTVVRGWVGGRNAIAVMHTATVEMTSSQAKRCAVDMVSAGACLQPPLEGGKGSAKT